MLPENVEKVVLACVALHNFIKLNDMSLHQSYQNDKYVDWEDNTGTVHPRQWREEVEPIASRRVGSNNASRRAFSLSDILKDYFMSDGAVPFQFNRK